MRNQPNHYLDWLESHARKELTLAEWFDVITTFYSIDFQGSNTGRPSKLKKRVAIQFFLEYGKSDYMKYALEKVGVYRSTAWPWKHRYWTVDAMYRLAPTLNYKQRAEFPFYWKRIRKQRIRLLQQKRGGGSSPSRNSIGRRSAYKSFFVTRVESTLEATAQKLGVSMRTVITWMGTYPKFRRAILLRWLGRELPIFEKHCNRFEVDLAHSLAHFKFDKENPNDT